MRLGREPDDDEAERGEDRRRGGVDRWIVSSSVHDAMRLPTAGTST